MGEYFRRSAVSEIAKQSLDQNVMFYARVTTFVSGHPHLVVVEDGNQLLVVDFSNIDAMQVEKGEYYRFSGQASGVILASGSRFAHVLLQLTPYRCDGYDADVYGRSLLVKRNFLSGFDALVGFVLKHG